MKSEDFYITLPSNVKSYFPENTVGNYKTKLSQKLVIPHDQKWKVGLAEISYTKSYYNVMRRQPIIFNEDRYFSTTQEQEASNKVVKGDLSDTDHQLSNGSRLISRQETELSKSKQRKHNQTTKTDAQTKPVTTTTATATTIQPKPTTTTQSKPVSITTNTVQVKPATSTNTTTTTQPEPVSTNTTVQVKPTTTKTTTVQVKPTTSSTTTQPKPVSTTTTVQVKPKPVSTTTTTVQAEPATAQPKHVTTTTTNVQVKPTTIEIKPTTIEIKPTTIEIKPADIQFQPTKTITTNIKPEPIKIPTTATIQPEPVITTTTTAKQSNLTYDGFNEPEIRTKKYNEIRELLRDAENFKTGWDDKLVLDMLFALHSLEQFRRGDEISDTEMDNTKVAINDKWSNLPLRLAKRLSLVSEGIKRMKEEGDTFLQYIGDAPYPNVQGDEPVKKKGQYIDTQQGVIKPGFYDDIEILVKHLNEQMQVHKWVSFCFIKYDRYSHRVTVKPGIDIEGNLYYPDFGGEVERILGLVDYKDKTLFDYLKMSNLSKELTSMIHSLVNGEKWKSFRPVELHASFHTLYLYTNIVQHSFVGDSFSQLLRQIEIPQNSRWGEQIVLKYEEPHYIPLCTNIIEVIEVDFKDELGNTLPFEFGRTIVKLHFVRYE